MQTLKLQFPTMFKRFKGLRKFKKEHRNVKVIKKGFSTTGCGGEYYWAMVQYES